MIASVDFRNFKALRATRLALAPFNLVIGPNGSGKTSLIESMLMLRSLSRLGPPVGSSPRIATGPEIEFHFTRPHEAITARLGCVSEVMCDVLAIDPAGATGWEPLRAEIDRIRSFSLDHRTMGAPSPRAYGAQLNSDGSDLAAVLANIRERDAGAFAALTAEMLRLAPEFDALELTDHSGDRVDVQLRLREDGAVASVDLSQGILYLLALLALVFEPAPPPLVCIEEIDRGIHPRLLRDVRDLLYRLSYPQSFGLQRPPTQVIATTHSPYLIDQFREHPEEVVISQKRGRAAHFERLADRPDLPELLREGTLGDMWFSGILGGVPEEK